jgi:hypothetical protein
MLTQAIFAVSFGEHKITALVRMLTDAYADVC